ncbi:MAG: cytochrome c biogenesis protein ResB [Verrucomicrobiota bacterium]|nr:cytochrome c biogenesis protein ResB [Verrucomicrobiota bacterium]
MIIKQIVSVITSLRLTVTCLSFSMLIVFVGTLAQVDQGLYIVQERYFKSFLVLWGPSGSDWQVPVMPGGYLIGILLLTNLTAAFFKRFKLTRKKFGIYMSHAGLIVLLLGQIFTDILSRESAMEIKESGTSSHSADFKLNELVLIDQSKDDEDTVYSVPEALLQSKEGATLGEDPLPFRINVLAYWSNASLKGKPETGYTRVDAITGFPDVYIKTLPPETAMDRRDAGAAILELLEDGNSIGKWFVSTILDPQTIEHDGKIYALDMRPKRYYENFSITLLRATHENYTGTNEPKNFASRVQLRNGQTGEDRELLIYMNHPLRYQGLTFFQHQMTAGEMVRRQGMTASSTFQVVKNPTWLTPYLGCALVGIGLTIQFMVHLVGFTRKRKSSQGHSGPAVTK